MLELAVKLIRGVSRNDISKAHGEVVKELERLKLLKIQKNQISLDRDCIIGHIDISRDGTGYLKLLKGDNSKDILIEQYDLKGAGRKDLVIAKRLFHKKGRPSAKVVYILDKSRAFSLAYLTCEGQNYFALDLKNEIPIELNATKKSLKQLPLGTVFKVNNSGDIMEVLGVLDDPSVDELISLALFNRKNEFSAQAESEASAYGSAIDKSLYPERIDLTDLPFVTIDPATAKDHDDAIYYDKSENAVYIAIADVTEYVTPNSAIDKEARDRGFSVYFPHKSIPMLPRALSENICSLKEGQERLAFVCRVVLDKKSLEPLEEKFFEAIIKSRRFYTYDRVDEFLEGSKKGLDAIDKEVLKYLIPLSKLTEKLKKKRLESGYDFENDEVRIKLGKDLELIETTIEKETPSHGLIEDCMLLANRASAKMFEFGIFRIHEQPKEDKIDELVQNLAIIGVYAKCARNLHEMIRELQKEAENKGIKKHVDKMIIKSQKQASYSAKNVGHFGLGFTHYTHFTSPIRRYSDLTLHRLLKAILQENEKEEKYILRNIEALATKISELEREAAKCEWDYQDRVFARWAFKNMEKSYIAVVTDTQKSPIAVIEDEVVGARVFLKNYDLEMFDKVRIQIIDSNIASTRITGRVLEVIREE